MSGSRFLGRLAVGVAAGAFVKQRYNTYRDMYNGKASFLEATKQNARGAFDLGVGFTPLPVRSAVAAARVGMADSADRSKTAVDEIAGTVSPIDLKTIGQTIDSVPAFKEKYAPFVEEVKEKGYTYVQSTRQGFEAMTHEERRGRTTALELLERVSDPFQ